MVSLTILRFTPRWHDTWISPLHRRCQNTPEASECSPKAQNQTPPEFRVHALFNMLTISFQKILVQQSPKVLMQTFQHLCHKHARKIKKTQPEIQCYPMLLQVTPTSWHFPARHPSTWHWDSRKTSHEAAALWSTCGTKQRHRTSSTCCNPFVSCMYLARMARMGEAPRDERMAPNPTPTPVMAPQVHRPGAKWFMPNGRCHWQMWQKMMQRKGEISIQSLSTKANATTWDSDHPQAHQLVPSLFKFKTAHSCQNHAANPKQLQGTYCCSNSCCLSSNCSCLKINDQDISCSCRNSSSIFAVKASLLSLKLILAYPSNQSWCDQWGLKMQNSEEFKDAPFDLITAHNFQNKNPKAHAFYIITPETEFS